MTIEEAAATLGLAPHEVAPEQVERNYRLKAMHCHPDRASYPGAAAEFKRATEAFRRLKNPEIRPAKAAADRADSDVARAAEQFSFGTAFGVVEPWLHLSWSEWLGKFAGTHDVRLRTAGRIAKDQPLAELLTGRVNAPSRPILIAPVDVEVLAFESTRFLRTWVLRPVETSRVRLRIERLLAEGYELDSAVKCLSAELFEAARKPVMV